MRKLVKTNLCCLFYCVISNQMTTLNWNSVGFKPFWLMSDTKHLDFQIQSVGFICWKAILNLADDCQHLEHFAE